MKPTNKLTVILLLTLVSSACNLGRPTPNAEATLLVPTPSAPPDGFITGTSIDVTTLPALAQVPAGGEPMPCFVENTEPSISLGYGIFPYQSLCLNNFPTAPDSPAFTVTLTAPTGPSFSETFTYDQDHIVNSKGTTVGYIEDGSGIDGNPGTPGVTIEVYLPASLLCGDWSVSANTQDGAINVGPTTLTMACDAPLVSVLPDLSTNPFVLPGYGQEGPAFANGETIYVVGTAFPPGTVITVAFYQSDPAARTSESGQMLGTAKYAVSVMTDSSGNFQAPFVVGSSTQRGAYYAIAAPAITPDLRLSPFSARFSIK